MRWSDRLVGFARRERTALVLAALFALALALAERFDSWSFDWSFLVSLTVCLAGGLAVGRWWALAVPVLVELILSTLDGAVPLLFADPYLILAVAVAVGLRKTAASFVVARGRVRLDRVGLAGLALYVLSAAGFTVLVLLESFDGPITLALVVLAGVHLVSGFTIGRWPAVFLPVLLIVLAIPVPTHPDAYEPIPLWLAMLLWLAPLGAAILALGVGTRRLVERRRESPRTGERSAHGIP